MQEEQPPADPVPASPELPARGEDAPSLAEPVTASPGLPPHEAPAPSPALSQWMRPRRLLFVVLFVVTLGGPFFWYACGPEIPSGLPGGPTVTLREADAASFPGGGEAAVDAAADSMIRIGFATVKDFLVFPHPLSPGASGDAASAGGEAAYGLAPIRLMTCRELPCFGELHMTELGVPRVRMLTAMKDGRVLISSSLDAEPVAYRAVRWVVFQHAASASPRNLLGRHQVGLARMAEDGPAESDLTEGRYAYHLSRLFAGRVP